MSLIVTTYVPTGIVMSTDCRMSMVTTQPSGPLPVPPVNPGTAAPIAPTQPPQTLLVLSDAANKLFLLFDRFGVSFCGTALIDGMPVGHHVESFEQSRAGNAPGSTQQLATDILAFFRAMNPVPDVWLHVCGYDGGMPSVFVVEVQANNATRHNHNGQGVTYGVRWNGDSDIANRLAGGTSTRIAYDALNVQDAIDLSRHLIRSTIDQMRFELRYPSVGGPIETLLLATNSAQFLARRQNKCT